MVGRRGARRTGRRTARRVSRRQAAKQAPAPEASAPEASAPEAPPVPEAAPQEDPYAKLKEAKELLDAGILTEEEFAAEKKRILGD